MGHELPAALNVKEGHLDLGDFYDAERLQYKANELLHYIATHHAVDGGKVMGLFSVDFFIPIFTYIFGQAYLNGNIGIASVYRLNNERYGMPADEQLLLQRFSKVIIHELGHSFGLLHCHVPGCVMRSGSYVEDLDQKGMAFCPTCRIKFHTDGLLK